MDPIREVVLVHGSWHGGWCWDAVVGELKKRGIPVKTVELPSVGERAGEATLDDDVAAVRSVLDTAVNPVVLCGHSYGGVVAGEAADHPIVEHVVFLAAFMLELGECLLDLAYGDPPPALTRYFREQGDVIEVAPEGRIISFYADCDPVLAAEAAARLRPMSIFPAGTPVTRVGWREKDTTYVLATQDEAITIDNQRFMARRADNVVSWDTSHSPMLSRPDLVSDLLEKLAKH